MASIKLTTITYLDDQPIEDFTDAQLFEYIRQTENHVAHLSAIENKPKKLQAQIDELKADIQTLVDYIDARTTKD